MSKFSTVQRFRRPTAVCQEHVFSMFSFSLPVQTIRGKQAHKCSAKMQLLRPIATHQRMVCIDHQYARNSRRIRRTTLHGSRGGIAHHCAMSCCWLQRLPHNLLTRGNSVQQPVGAHLNCCTHVNNLEISRSNVQHANGQLTRTILEVSCRCDRNNWHHLGNLGIHSSWHFGSRPFLRKGRRTPPCFLSWHPLICRRNIQCNLLWKLFLVRWNKYRCRNLCMLFHPCRLGIVLRGKPNNFDRQLY